MRHIMRRIYDHRGRSVAVSEDDADELDRLTSCLCEIVAREALGADREEATIGAVIAHYPEVLPQ